LRSGARPRIGSSTRRRAPLKTPYGAIYIRNVSAKRATAFVICQPPAIITDACQTADYFQYDSDNEPGASEDACDGTEDASWCARLDHPGDATIQEAQCFGFGKCENAIGDIPDPLSPAPTITFRPTTPPPTAESTPKPTGGGSTDGAVPRHAAMELAVAAAAFVAYLAI